MRTRRSHLGASAQVKKPVKDGQTITKHEDTWDTKSRIVAHGFTGRILGQYRRDAPTASRLAEAFTNLTIVTLGFVAFLGDIRSAYHQGKEFEITIYLEQPQGGLPGLEKGKFLVAKKGIYGCAEAARLFFGLHCKTHSLKMVGSCPSWKLPCLTSGIMANSLAFFVHMSTICSETIKKAL